MSVTSLAVTPNGCYVFAGFVDGTLCLLNMHVAVSEDCRFVFAGVLRGSTEMLAADLAALPTWETCQSLRASSDHARALSEAVTLHSHSDAKLKGFGAAALLGGADGASSGSGGGGAEYRLLCGRGIKNIHVWSFKPAPPGSSGAPLWQCIHDVQTNGMTVELVGFRDGARQGLSKSDHMCIRLWDLSDDGGARRPGYTDVPNTQDAKDAKRRGGGRRPGYTDVPNTQDAKGVFGDFAYGGTYSLSLVRLDAAAWANRAELALPPQGSAAAAGGGGSGAGGGARRHCRVIKRLAGTQDGRHVLVLCSDGQVLYHRHAANGGGGTGAAGDAHSRLQPLGALLVDGRGEDVPCTVALSLVDAGAGAVPMLMIADCEGHLKLQVLPTVAPRGAAATAAAAAGRAPQATSAGASAVAKVAKTAATASPRGAAADNVLCSPPLRRAAALSGGGSDAATPARITPRMRQKVRSERTVTGSGSSGGGGAAAAAAKATPHARARRVAMRVDFTSPAATAAAAAAAAATPVVGTPVLGTRSGRGDGDDALAHGGSTGGGISSRRGSVSSSGGSGGGDGDASDSSSIGPDDEQRRQPLSALPCQRLAPGRERKRLRLLSDGSGAIAAAGAAPKLSTDMADKENMRRRENAAPSPQDARRRPGRRASLPAAATGSSAPVAAAAKLLLSPPKARRPLRPVLRVAQNNGTRTPAPLPQHVVTCAAACAASAAHCDAAVVRAARVLSSLAGAAAAAVADEPSSLAAAVAAADAEAAAAAVAAAAKAVRPPFVQLHATAAATAAAAAAAAGAAMMEAVSAMQPAAAAAAANAPAQHAWKATVNAAVNGQAELLRAQAAERARLEAAFRLEHARLRAAFLGTAQRARLSLEVAREGLSGGGAEGGALSDGASAAVVAELRVDLAHLAVEAEEQLADLLARQRLEAWSLQALQSGALPHGHSAPAANFAFAQPVMRDELARVCAAV
ncbi:hypothetical protein JKP88DRAFT_332443 [Tribonema minus]|uniref:Uncharacterized protein n=1 Tax=Tribonema minus TaxID=303371 RepID=A0A835YLG3_9STRA|nr:hypothetical protein JKP88DRAFT_332443 [Tribonema minus]